MSSRLAALAIAGAALVLPASAAAKELTKVTICGQGGCHSTEDRSRLATLPVGGTPTDPPKAAAFYRVTVHMRAERPGLFRMYFLSGQGLLREQPVHGSWMRAEPAQAAALAALARGLKPFPAAKLPYARLPLPDVTPVPIATPAPPVRASSGGSLPWPIVLAAAVGLAGAAMAARLVARRRGPATE